MVGVGADNHTLGISAREAKAVLRAGVGCRPYDTCRAPIVHPQALLALTRGSEFGPSENPDILARLCSWVQRHQPDLHHLTSIRSYRGWAARAGGEDSSQDLNGNTRTATPRRKAERV